MKNNFETFTYEVYDEHNPRSADQKTRDHILERDLHTCRYCGSCDEPFHIDHVYPYSKGGKTIFDNLVTSCQSCNQKKSSKVGMWPKPIGYFYDLSQTRKTSLNIKYLLFLSITLLISGMGGVVFAPEINYVNYTIITISAFLFLSTFWRMPEIS